LSSGLIDLLAGSLWVISRELYSYHLSTTTVVRSVEFVGKLTTLQLLLVGMTAAVRIDEEAKAELEKLQAEIKLKTGKRVTKQELLSQLIRSATDNRSEFIDSFRDGQVALSEADIGRFNQGMIASGVETAESDIDETLYE